MEVEAVAATPAQAPGWLTHRGVIAAAAVAVVIAIQIWAGSYNSERGCTPTSRRTS